MAHKLFDRRGDGAPPLVQRDDAGLIIDRRAVLKTAFATIGAYAATAAGVTWVIAPDRAWAMEFAAFDEKTASTLLQMARALYPHEKVGDVHYAKVVKSLDDAVAGSDDASAALAVYTDGVARLNETAGGDFNAVDADAKEAALQAEADGEDPSFFQAVRGQMVNGFYNDPEVWKIFGYQGASYEEGGYLFRGFDDLSWLPAPSKEASPPAQDA